MVIIMLSVLNINERFFYVVFEDTLIDEKDRHYFVVEGLGKKYEHGTSALTNINFAVESGELIGIVGPIKSGKSVLLHILTHLMRATTGNIYYGLSQELTTDLNVGKHMNRLSQL